MQSSLAPLCLSCAEIAFLYSFVSILLFNLKGVHNIIKIEDVNILSFAHNSQFCTYFFFLFFVNSENILLQGFGDVFYTLFYLLNEFI